MQKRQPKTKAPSASPPERSIKVKEGKGTHFYFLLSLLQSLRHADDDVSSPSTRPPIQEDESDSATSASQEAASGASSRKSHGDAKRTGSSNKGSVGSEADLNIEDSGGRTSAKVLSEETNQRLGLQRVGDGPQSRLNSVSQGKAKRVVFSEGADEERPVTLRGDHGEGSREDSAEKAGAGEKDSERSYGAFGNSWDDEEFSFGASTSGKVGLLLRPFDVLRVLPPFLFLSVLFNAQQVVCMFTLNEFPLIPREITRSRE